MGKLYDDDPYDGSGDFKYPLLVFCVGLALIGAPILLLVALFQ
jgi:hypothetical protein